MKLAERDIFFVHNQPCPACGKEKATFSEYEIEDPYCGPIAIFAVKCEACGYKSSDLEILEKGEPLIYEVDIESPEDLNIRIIKSGSCEIQIPTLGISYDSEFVSDGFISNVEGVLNRFKTQVEFLSKDPDLSDREQEKLAKIRSNIDKVIDGKKKIKLILKDRSGNSAIISDKVKTRPFDNGE